MFLIGLYVVMVGACIGSFIHVVALRYVHHENLWNGRSCCDHCHHQIPWYDLIPIVSYIVLRGRCRFCKEPIGIRHLIVELTMGAAYWLIWQQVGLTWRLPILYVIVALFMCLSLIDMDTMIIPNGLILLLGAVMLLDMFFMVPIGLVWRLAGMLSMSGLMLLINIIAGNGFGGGDIKLMFVCGFWLGLRLTIVAGIVAIVLAGIKACYLLLKKSVGKKDYIAFGPYLCMGVFLSLLYGEWFLNWYLNIF